MPSKPKQVLVKRTVTTQEEFVDEDALESYEAIRGEEDDADGEEDKEEDAPRRRSRK